MDSDGNYFYIKSANQNGKVSILIFKYQEVTQDNQPKPEQPKVEYALGQILDFILTARSFGVNI